MLLKYRKKNQINLIKKKYKLRLKGLPQIELN